MSKFASNITLLESTIKQPDKFQGLGSPLGPIFMKGMPLGGVEAKDFKEALETLAGFIGMYPFEVTAYNRRTAPEAYKEKMDYGVTAFAIRAAPEQSNMLEGLLNAVKGAKTSDPSMLVEWLMDRPAGELKDSDPRGPGQKDQVEPAGPASHRLRPAHLIVP